jgi:hypothetical protein
MSSSLSVTSGRSVVSPGIPVSSTKKTGHKDIAEILLKMALNTIALTHYVIAAKVYPQSRGIIDIKNIKNSRRR